MGIGSDALDAGLDGAVPMLVAGASVLRPPMDG